MAKVKKAVITAAGMGTRHFPATQAVQKELLPLVDRDGTTKPTIQIILEEAQASGVEEFCLIVSPRMEEPFKKYFRRPSEYQMSFLQGKTWALEQIDRVADLGERITFAVQEQQEGYGHAVYQAREFVGDEPFLLLLGDHVFISGTDKPCSRQLIDVYDRYETPISGVQRTPEDLLHLFGTLSGTRIDRNPDTYDVTLIKEKPSIEFAEEHLQVEGLRRGEYLTFFGVHVFPPQLFDLIEYHIRNDIREKGEIQLTSSLEMLRSQGRYLASEIKGSRHDMGVPFGYVETQLALALNSPMRRQLWSALPNLLNPSDTSI